MWNDLVKAALSRKWIGIVALLVVGAFFSGLCLGERLGKWPVLITGGSGQCPHDALSLTIYESGYKLNASKIAVRQLRVADAEDKEYPWKAEVIDSLMGPALYIQIDSRQANKSLCASGEIEYKGFSYGLVALWEEAEDTFTKHIRWRLVSCTFYPQ
jgi:hypothetical protein